MKIFVVLFCFVDFFNDSFLFTFFSPHSSLLKPKFIFFKKSIWLLCYGSPHKAMPTVPEASKSYQIEGVSSEGTVS